MPHKPEQAQRFYAALTGMSSPPLTFQTFYDPKEEKDPVTRRKPHEHLARVWYDYFNPAPLIDLQMQGCGVFTCINGSTTGGRKAADIDIFRALFIDSDGLPLPPSWTINPHAINMRDANHYHAYFFIDGACTSFEWSVAQRHLAIYYGSDDSIFNADRVMRIPGFIHQKDLARPAVYELAWLADETVPRYSLRQVVNAHPLTELQQHELAEWIRKRSGEFLNEAADYDDCEGNVNKCIEYLRERASHGVDGQGRNKIRFQTAAACRDYGLSPDMTVQLMLEHWDHGNTPPCGQELIEQATANAYRYGSNKLGSRSFGIMLNAPIVGVPGMSDTLVEETISFVEAPALRPALMVTGPDAPLVQVENPGFYGKNHTTNAQTFCNQFSPNGEIVVSEGDIYMFNGKHYQKRDDEFLHRQLLKAMMHCTPSQSDLNGSVSIAMKMLGDGVPEEWPNWRDEPGRDTSGLIIFNNGILDTVTNEWFEHSPRLRALHALPFDYNPAATCPTWEGFLMNMWGNSKYQPLIGLLQQWFGYILVSDMSQQKMVIVTGKPRSGKGTMMRVARDMVGEFNSSDPSLENLAESAFLHDMSGKLVAFFNDVTEPSAGKRMAIVANIKRIVGMDAIMFNRKYKSTISAKFKCRMMLTSNEIPNLSETSTAMIDRGIFFHCPRSNAGKEDLGLSDRLKTEMPGIINWAIKGLAELRRVGRLVNDSCMDERIKLFLLNTSPLEVFVQDCFDIDTSYECDVQKAYKRFIGWSNENNGGNKRALSSFARAMDASKHIELGLSDGRQVFRGARLRDIDTMPEYGEIPTHNEAPH